ncbi:ABC transporter permease [Anaerotalea alkaliphila]|uniref:FtsX-like permease family protein n=1 Tax=Anaerotalea alkaliphila TaxID=2662126 RepID=A0A7X5KLE1_9FIRM|nr:ABC transporter permease [Anaerotalea alkaliphila]NDL66604.1 FtsX-like permease family protein [Anaerotalea alkaliphila]
MKKLNLRLVRTMRHAKGQLAALLAVMVTGLFIFTAITSAATNLQTSLESYYDQSNFGDVFVELMHIPSQEVDGLVGDGGIVEAKGRYAFTTPFLTDDPKEIVNVRVVSSGSSTDGINELHLYEGSRSIGENRVLVLEKFATARGLEVEDRFHLQIAGQRREMVVAGIVGSPEYIYLMENEQALMPRPGKFGVVFVEESYLGSIAGTGGIYNEVVFKLEDRARSKEAEDHLEEALDRYGVRRIIPRKDQLSNNVTYQEIEGLQAMTRTVPFIFLFAAGGILATLMGRMVKNDRMAIGVLKAMGYRNRTILGHYMKFALFVGITGGILGTLLGTVLSGFMTQLYLDFFAIPLLEVRFYPENIVASLVLATVVCMASGFLGARNVLAISPAESMKPEAPRQGHRILLERIRFLWNQVSFTWKIVFRNIFREKKKFLLVSLGGAFTLGMMTMTFWMNSIYGVLFEEHYGHFMSMDYTIHLDGFFHERAVRDLGRLIEADHLEPKLEVPFELYNGAKSGVVNVVGLVQGTRFYNFSDAQGHEVPLPVDGMLISSNLALKLGVGEGDLLRVRNFLPGKEDSYIRVRGVIEQTLGINAYMELEWMGTQLVERGAVNGALVATDQEIIPLLEDVERVGGVQSTEELQAIFLEFMDLTLVSIGFMLFFSGILGFVIVYSMTIMSIHERKLEFASLRVLGFTRGELFGLILKENLVMTLLGFVMGVPLGLFFVEAVSVSFTSDLYTMNRPVQPEEIGLAMLFTTGCILLAQLATYKKIRHLDFIEALKNRTT